MPSDAFKINLILLYEFVALTQSRRQQVMPDDHSKLVPLLPIPNRTVKRLSADDSAGSRVKVGHRQAITALKTPHSVE